MDEFRPPQLSGEHVLQDWEQERREHEHGEGLSGWELSEHSGLTDSEQELSRLKTTIPVFYIVASIIIVLFLIVVILGVDVFHFW